MTAWDRLHRRARAWKACFFDERGHLTRDAEIALSHLRKFCRGGQSTLVVSPVSRMVDPIASGVAEGRREVFDRIVQYLNLDESVVAKLREEPEERDEFAA